MGTLNTKKMENLTKITGICKIKDEFTGHITQQDFLKYNCHVLQFYINKKFVSVDVAGFSSNNFFYFNPTLKQKRLNDFFINRYVLPCENASEILDLIK